MSEAPYQVLVVDDTLQNVMLAEALLKSQGYLVGKAADGPQCLAAVEKQPPDLILLDVMMPGMTGFDVCKHLKQHKENRHIPIILLTSLSASEDRIAGIEAGADDFITKPFNRHELLARVKSLSKLKRMAEREREYVKSTMERYMDSTVAQYLMEHPELGALGGRRQEVSVLFTDVRSFTTWSEGVSAEAVVEVMNAFLALAIEIVFWHGGMVDKFTGDGLMAVFGAPVPQEDHRRRAGAGERGDHGRPGPGGGPGPGAEAGQAPSGACPHVRRDKALIEEGPPCGSGCGRWRGSAASFCT